MTLLKRRPSWLLSLFLLYFTPSHQTYTTSTKTVGVRVFTLVHHEADWTTAKASCESTGASLVSIHNSAENNAIKSWNTNVWIGGRKVSNTWTWVDGTPMDYTNWASREPNNHGGIEDSIVFPTHGKWNDYPGSRAMKYVCVSATNTPTLTPSTASPATNQPSQTPTSANPTCTPTTSSPATNQPSQTPTSANPTCAPTTASPATNQPSQTPTSANPTVTPTTTSPSSCAPSTLSPTSMSPSTTAPSSCSPSTLSPTSMSPSTTAPSSCSPTTVSPSTSAPTLNPSSLSPSSYSPSTATPTISPPEIIRTKTSSDLTHIWLFFQKDTNRPDITCAEMLIPEALSKLGRGPTCIWEAPRALKVFFGSKATLLLGEELGLKANVVLDYTLTIWNERTTIRFIRPETIAPPLAILTAPDFVGSCGGCLVDASSSIGSYGRDLEFSWGYSGPSVGISKKLADLPRSLSQISLESSNLTAGLHTFNISVINWIGDVATAATTLTRFPAAIPKIDLPCPSSIHVKASEEQVIRVRVSDPCLIDGNGEDDTGILRVIWSQLSPATPYLPISLEKYRPDLSPHFPVNIPARDSSILRIPSMALRMGASYALQIRATLFERDGTFRSENNATIILHTITQPVIAAIKGGAMRDVFSHPEGHVTFDASSSTDPGAKEALLFQWQLLHLRKGIEGSVNAVNWSSAALWVASKNSSILHIPRSLLSSSESYLVRVNVSTATTLRMGVAEQTVNIVDVPIPLVKTSIFSSKRASSNEAAEPATTFSSSSKITLFADVELGSYSSSNSSSNFSLAGAAYSLKWQCLNCKEGFLSSAASSNKVLSSLTSQSLVFAPNALLPSAIYEFQVTVAVGAGNQRAARSQIKLTMNSKPQMGTCAVSPSSGESLRTTFKFSCSNWVDDDLPLTYKFQDISGWIPSDLCKFRLLPRYESVLFFNNDINKHNASRDNSDSSGAGERGFETNEEREYVMLPLKAIISDSLGTQSDFKLEAKVFAQETDFSKLQTTIDSQLQRGDLELMSQYFRAAALSSASNTSLASSPAKLQVEEAAGVKQNLTRVVQLLMEGRRDRPFEERVNLPLEMMDQVTMFEQSDHANFVPADVRSSVLGMLDTLIEEEELGQVAIEYAVGALSNIAAAVAGADIGVESSVADEADDAKDPKYTHQREEKINSSRTVTRLLSKVSDQLVKTLSLDESAAVVSSPRADLLGRLCSLEATPGAVVAAPFSSSTVAVTVSPSLRINSTQQSGGTNEGRRSADSVAVKVSYLKSQPFPPQGSSDTNVESRALPLNSLLVVELSQGNRTIQVQNESEPFVLALPYAPAPASGESTSHICEYWNEDAQRWSSAGVRPEKRSRVEENSTLHNRLVCLSYHLTAFAVRVNTFGEDDIKAEAFSYTNAVAVFMFALLGGFCVTMIIACRYDRELERKSGLAASQRFWRRNNKMIQDRIVEPRSASRFTSSIKWSVQRKHPWASVVLRHEGDHITSSKRVAVLCVLLFNSMTVCALLCGQDQQILFLSNTASLAIVTTLMAFPVPYVIYSLVNRPPPMQYKMAVDVQNRSEILQWLFCVLALVMNEYVQMNFDSGEDEQGADADENDNDQGDNINRDEDDEDDANASASEGDSEDEEDFMHNNESKTAAIVAASVGARGGAGVANKRRRHLLRLQKSLSCNMISSNHKSYAQFQSVQTMKDANDDSQLSERDSRCCCSASNSCRCDPVGPYDEDTHKWHRHDYVAMTAAAVITSGCFFILGVLSYSLRHQYGRWTVATATGFAYDFGLRFFSILLFEIVVMAPLLALCMCGGRKTDAISSEKQQQQQLEEDRKDSVPVVSILRFSTGNDVGISYYNRKIVNVEPGSQAAQQGVRFGWKITSINGEPIRSDRQCNREVFKAHRLSEWLQIGFLTRPLRRSQKTNSPPSLCSSTTNNRSTQFDSIPVSNGSKLRGERLTQQMIDSHYTSARSSTASHISSRNGGRTPDEHLDLNRSVSESTTFSQLERNDSSENVSGKKPVRDDDDAVSETFSQMEREDFAAALADTKESICSHDDDDASSTFSQMEKEDVGFENTKAVSHQQDVTAKLASILFSPQIVVSDSHKKHLSREANAITKATNLFQLRGDRKKAMASFKNMPGVFKRLTGDDEHASLSFSQIEKEDILPNAVPLISEVSSPNAINFDEKQHDMEGKVVAEATKPLPKKKKNNNNNNKKPTSNKNMPSVFRRLTMKSVRGAKNAREIKPTRKKRSQLVPEQRGKANEPTSKKTNRRLFVKNKQSGEHRNKKKTRTGKMVHKI